jgi:hypothetical protein
MSRGIASICLGLIKQCCQPQYAAFSHSLEFLAEPLGLKGDFFLESEVPREISSVYFLAHFYLNALGTMAEFYVSLTPTQLRSLQEASARNFSEYLGQLESMVGFLLPNESYSRPYATLPPICGRVLTRYGLFWYHSVSNFLQICAQHV